jgi:hypothetical protein
MWTYEEERKILHARLKMLGKFPLSAEPSGAATRKKPREKNGDNGGDDEDDDDDVDEDDDGEGDGGPKSKARTGSKNNDDEDLEDDPSSRLLPNEKEFMSLSRSCFSTKTKKKAKALPEMSMDEKKEGLNWALENDLIQSVVFKNLELSQKYVLNDLDGSGCFIKLKEKSLAVHEEKLTVTAGNTYYRAKRKSEGKARLPVKKAKQKGSPSSSEKKEVCVHFDTRFKNEPLPLRLHLLLHC